jgi:hypothetical protein
MASKRKFYRTIIQIEVLSEEPYSKTDLETIAEDISIGHQSGIVTIPVDSEEMDGKTCAAKLKKQGSDTEFFSLDEHGNDTEDVIENEDDDSLYDGEPKVKKVKKDKFK